MTVRLPIPLTGSKNIRCGMGLLVVWCALSLSACTQYRRATPDVPRQPQATRPQAAIPPTQKPYTVNGTRYEPLSSHEGFEQEGQASSYGKEFHGRKTSSGEPFDMHAMTAAHKTLPLGVYVRVRHKRTNNEVIVRINDRGPFVRDRIIDLSEASARQLGILQEGVAPVKVTALGYRDPGDPSTARYRPGNYDAGTFALQVGSFSVRANAYRYADELRQRYGSADVQEAQVDGKQFFRVRLGRYSSLKNAQAAQDQFERKGFNGNFVVAVD